MKRVRNPYWPGHLGWMVPGKMVCRVFENFASVPPKPVHIGSPGPDLLFDFPEEIGKIIYTTNAVESLPQPLRKVTKNRGSFPTQEAAIKLLYLALQNVSKMWHTVRGWRDTTVSPFH